MPIRDDTGRWPERREDEAPLLAPARASDETAGPIGAQADLGEIAEALRRRAGLIAATTLVSLGLAVAYLAVAKPKFLSSTAILVDARQRPPLGSDAQLPNAAPDLALIDSQLKVIGSEAVLRRVVEKERLDLDPEFAPSGPGLRQRVTRMLGLGKADPEAERADKTMQAARALAEAITAKRSERTYVLDVDALTGDPAKSARVANAVARAYIEDLQGSASELARRNGEWIRARLAELQAKVEQADSKVADFRSRQGLLDANGKSVNDSDLADVAAQVTAARARVSEAKARYDQIRRIADSGLTPDGVGDPAKSAALDRLRAQLAEAQRQESNARSTLGPRHPAAIEIQQQIADTRRAIRAEARRLVDVAQAEILATQAQERAAQRRLDEAKSQTSLDGKAMVELRELERDAAASRAAYERFLRARETVREDATDGPMARVISPAVAPLAPASPKKIAILAMALAAGLGFGAALALARDFFSVERRQMRTRLAEGRRAHRERLETSLRARRDVAQAAEPEPTHAVQLEAALHPATGEELYEDASSPAPARFAPAGTGRSQPAPRAAPSRRAAVACVWFDPSALEDGLFEAAPSESELFEAELTAWRLLDATAAHGGARLVVMDLSARRRPGAALRAAVAIARAASGRGERAAAIVQERGAHFDAFTAGEPEWAMTFEDGGARAAYACQGETGSFWIVAPSAPSQRARRLDPRRAEVDFEVVEARHLDEIGAGDAVVALLGAREDAGEVEGLGLALAARGARLVAALKTQERRRPRRGRAA